MFLFSRSTGVKCGIDEDIWDDFFQISPADDDDSLETTLFDVNLQSKPIIPIHDIRTHLWVYRFPFNIAAVNLFVVLIESSRRKWTLGSSRRAMDDPMKNGLRGFGSLRTLGWIYL